MAQVSLKNVSKIFPGNVQAIRDINLGIENKEFVVLVGPSGCGKSTTLRIIAGLEEASEGDVYIGNQLVNDVPPKDRNIAMVFQNYALYPHMSVYDNMAFGLKLRKYPKAEIDTRVKEAATILGIEKLLHRKPRELSGGQRQRVAVGRSIVRKPLVFLFDEPLSNLDAKMRVQMRTEIKKLHIRLQTTMIYVTHDQVEAMTMADRIAVISEGRLQQVGPPQDVYDRPQNLFVARFIGSPPMDVVEGTVSVAGDAEATIDLGAAGSVSASVLAGRPLTDGRRVLVGIRPEHLVLGSGSLHGVVGVIESLGHERHLFIDLGGNQIICRQSAEDPAPTQGERVELNVAPRHVHVFDPESTERLN